MKAFGLMSKLQLCSIFCALDENMDIEQNGWIQISLIFEIVSKLMDIEHFNY